MQYLIAFLLGMTSVRVFEWIEESYRESSRASHDRIEKCYENTRANRYLRVCTS